MLRYRDLLLLTAFSYSARSACGSRHVKIEQPITAAADLAANSATDSALSADSNPPQADEHRIVACVQLRNELPYLIEWIEFHRVMGFTHMVIYDDFSSDNVTMLETLYKEHQRSYLTVVPPFAAGQDKFTHRAKTAEHCFLNFHHLADWMINMDVDEFVWSPSYPSLQQYFRSEVPSANHILHVGATRFGWSGQRDRFTYSLQLVANDSSRSVKLVNPNGVQLLVSSHTHRAADQRFNEPEEILKQSNKLCQQYAQELGEWSPCTNDYNGNFGKTFVRTHNAMSVWTHGGNVRLPYSNGNLPYTDIGLNNGGDIESEVCPSPICARADPFKLHIYHFRAPSMADSTKKNAEMGDVDEAALHKATAEQLAKSDALYEEETWFFNQIRDISLVRFADLLRERIAPLLSPLL
ncbi:hypothetical protein WJX74_003809 [Apatococcus lobatus]|uniref:Glycosyltransferase family 92 protein n=1 Tax=Apatococcus lobatus TaxID=904363 RepID=A0AAW1QHF5_9CHLO